MITFEVPEQKTSVVKVVAEIDFPVYDDETTPAALQRLENILKSEGLSVRLSLCNGDENERI